MAITFRGRDKNNVPVYQIDAYYMYLTSRF